MKQLLIGLLLLVGFSACSGEPKDQHAAHAAMEASLPVNDSLQQESAAPLGTGTLAPEIQRHVTEIDSLLEGI